MRSSKILVLTKTSLCVALLCVSAFIVIPIPFTPIMITAQMRNMFLMPFSSPYG